MRGVRKVPKMSRIIVYLPLMPSVAVDIAEALFAKVLLKMLQFLETVNASNKLIVRMGKARLD